MQKKTDVLVLNKSFVPIHIITWQRAMSLLIQDSARAIDSDYIVYDFSDWLLYSEVDDKYPKILTIKHKISLPSIIVLKNYNKLPIRDIKYSRETLFQRDNHTCAYCGGKFKPQLLTVDHILPRSLGGKTHWDNTVTACSECNGKKGNKTLEQTGMKLLYRPKKPKWVSPLTNIRSNKACKEWSIFLDRTLVNIGNN
jgi:5-methylcytosine-specific restriction endonuclease McrA